MQASTPVHTLSSAMLHPCRYELTPIASTGSQFRDFAPYVASISDDGAIAFQATLADARSGAFMHRDGQLHDLTSAEALVVTSHPDINDRGDCCFYASPTASPSALYALHDGFLRQRSPNAGPLGPTMNSRGHIAFRAAAAPSGEQVIARADDDETSVIAHTGREFTAFHGLPVIDDAGRILFRADRTDGSQALLLSDGADLRTIASTGPRFATLPAFPAMHDADCIVFAATLPDGHGGVFACIDGDLHAVIDESAGFESFRGALVDAHRRVVFFATPRRGSLGIFSGPDPHRHCILAVGSPLLDSSVAELALNPVSINSRGDLAIRVKLESGAQHIISAERER